MPDTCAVPNHKHLSDVVHFVSGYNTASCVQKEDDGIDIVGDGTSTSIEGNEDDVTGGSLHIQAPVGIGDETLSTCKVAGVQVLTASVELDKRISNYFQKGK